MKLQQYLASCQEALERLSEYRLVHLVLGNETCDLDSAVSSIVFAYYLHQTSSSESTAVLPVLNIPRGDFLLRTDVSHVLGQISVASGNLVFIDDLDLAKVKARVDLEVTLVDHHVLGAKLAFLEDSVVRILDHRPRDGDLPDRCKSTIETVGSCCTLVSEVLLSDQAFTMDSDVATLLYSTVVTDTINLSPAAGKTTAKDVAVLEGLEEVMGGRVDRNAVFEDIKTAKFDLSGLSTTEILRKDLKMVGGDSLMVAMSSVTMEMSTLMEREDFVSALREFAAERGVEVVVVMTVGIADGGDRITRQLAVFSPSIVYRQQIADVLSSSQSPYLGLSPLTCGCPELLPFAQGNVQASRKQVLPLVRGFLVGETTPDEAQLDAMRALGDGGLAEGFTSMSSIVDSRQSSRQDSRQDTLDGDITSEDLTSRQSSEEDLLSPDDGGQLHAGESGKVFDPLRSIHSSDGAASPLDENVNATKYDLDLEAWPAARDFVGDEGEEDDDDEEERVAGDSSISRQCQGQGRVTDPDAAHVNGLGEDGLDPDLLDLASPHDLLFPPFTPQDVSAATSGQVSGQGSGQGSQAPSYPVTPPNSFMDGGLMVKETELPSFNSSEMVEKIQEKKAALRGGGDEGGEEATGVLSPFTPQNSYAEAGLSSRETHLPSFHSSDMVERIREKRTSMERELRQGEEGEEGEGAEGLDIKSPFTPPNSFVEGGNLDSYARHHLPSLNNAETASKIRQRQAELSSSVGQSDSGTTSPLGATAASADSPAAPYTPQNSYRDSCLESLSVDSHLTDLNEVAERLSLTGSESSGSLSEPKAIKASNRGHNLGVASSAERQGFDVDETKGEALPSEFAAKTDKTSSFDSSQVPSESGEGRNDLDSLAGRKTVLFAEQTDEQVNSEIMEEAIQKIAFELANEMIQKALETFPSRSVKKLVPTEAGPGALAAHPSVSDDSSPTMDESDQEPSPDLLGSKSKVSPEVDISDRSLASSTDSERFAAEFGSGVKASSSLAEELAQAMAPKGRQAEDGSGLESFKERGGTRGYESPQSLPLGRGGDYKVETEYLSNMDPMQCVYSPESNVIATDANKEVVEGASFRKISGQEYQTVQEDILEEIRQEAKEREMARLKQTSVLEEDEDVQDDDAEAKTKIAPDDDLDLDASLTDEQGRRTIHVVRDRELYASALDNAGASDGDDDERIPESSLQPSNASHPLLDSSLDDSRTDDPVARRTIQAGDLDVESLSEEGHHYESFAETGSQGEEERAREATADRLENGRRNSSKAEERLKGAEFTDEWQDDELPSMIGDKAPPLTDAVAESRRKVVPEQSLVGAGDNLEHVPVVDSDSEIDSDMDNEQLEWENDTPVQPPPRPMREEVIPQYTAAQERDDAAHWKDIALGDGEHFRLDLRVIDPYKRVLSHGGYCGEGMSAMIVFSACYLPSRERRDYTYVMDHLFHYVLFTLDQLVADDYIIVYFHGATPRRQMPSFTWLKRCYQAIDRRLKKNLKALYLVHPTLWLKTVVLMTRPFISVKFSSKLQFVRCLDDLRKLIPMEYVYIPEIVQRYDTRHFHQAALQ